MKYLRIVMLLVGMAMVIGGGALFAKNYARTVATGNWPRAQARVTESRVETLHRQEVGNAGDFMPHVRYDYVVRGRTFRGDTLWLDEHRSFSSANVAARELAFLEAGTEVEVIYNPQDPREAALMVDKPTWRFFFLALLGALLSWVARPKRRAKPATPGQELVPAQATAGGPGPGGGR